MNEMTYRYPTWPKIQHALEAAVVGVGIVAGVGYLLARPPDTPRVWAVICGALAGMARYAFAAARSALQLSDSFRSSEAGLTYSRLGTLPECIPWTEVRRVREHGRRGDLPIEVQRRARPIRVHRWLIGLDELKAVLTERVGPWSAATGHVPPESRRS
ncbi:MAG: hypothetical protein ACM3JJ_09975 [Hyphomicrobiales bacterium]